MTEESQGLELNAENVDTVRPPFPELACGGRPARLRGTLAPARHRQRATWLNERLAAAGSARPPRPALHQPPYRPTQTAPFPPSFPPNPPGPGGDPALPRGHWRRRSGDGGHRGAHRQDKDHGARRQRHDGAGTGGWRAAMGAVLCAGAGPRHRARQAAGLATSQGSQVVDREPEWFARFRLRRLPTLRLLHGFRHPACVSCPTPPPPSAPRAHPARSAWPSRRSSERRSPASPPCSWSRSARTVLL